MNNQELELRVKEILAVENFFDMTVAAIEFEKEYKGTEFYKKTKMPLVEVIKNAKLWYGFQLNDIGSKLQKLINELDLSKLSELLSQLGDVFGVENEEIISMIKTLKDIVE
jgi:hypothetical protein